MLRLLLAACLIWQGIIRAESLHPVTGRQLPIAMGEGTLPEQALEDVANTALDLIGIQPGATVAAVGAGSCEFTWRLAERVGSAGRVFAVDT